MLTTASSIEAATGDLLVDGQRVFPLGLSDPPPLGSTAPNGRDAWAEVASAGAGFVRNYTVWKRVGLDEQLIAVAQELDPAPAHGLQHVRVKLVHSSASLSRGPYAIGVSLGR